MDSHLFRLNQMSYQHHKQLLSHQRAAAVANQSQQPLVSQRQHYSSRQQAGPANQPASSTVQRDLQQAKQHQHQNQNPHQQQPPAPPPHSQTSASSGSDQEELVQLSSLSTAATSKSSASSQAAILAGQKSSSQMQREHQQMLRQQQQQRHLQAGGGGGQHRQAALQAHTLAALPSRGVKQQQQHQGQQHKNSGSNNSNNLSSSDQLTTSSDQTIDDLHQLAPHHHHGAYAAAAAAAATTTGPGGARHHHHQHLARYEGLASAAPVSSSTLDAQSGSRFLLGVLFTLAELLLFATVLLWLYWAYQHDDGLGWQSDRKQQFNTHAALMLFGFIFLSGQAMLIHRSFSCCSKIYTKILHTILFVLATSAISLGLILAYTAQENVGANNKPIMHFYSLHAWCGLTTLGLFVLQFVFGFVSFLILLCCDQATGSYRAALLPIHKTFGLIIFSLAIATCLTGLLQTARSRLSSKLNKTDYHELAEPGIIINLIGVCLICLAILMPYIIRNLDIKRPSFRSEFDRHLNKLSQLEMRI